ncbi:hypothetical protein A3A68_02265 [Candidatus Saccharibacteria bacterium RIFCSPLOWO2_01_FULL_48_13]|nr:MAG: hypothetical protein A2884_02040 [Candidatus Saccharibacteria bacterium RIFCSPHIGHO2_01_FULL_48_12]OGL35207.1 MAG: hypothetical protein A3F38_02980 [Candidatus Saccharibacteria bacterium RIFCSPHIGHO2_12_FULL_48_21]OGL36752.1 MAG: hypothetical protein A3A68_02265 [Candidatus Saccharibacteria bacterium RIFCSPLOWO2_01_FULL_48_13]
MLGLLVCVVGVVAVMIATEVIWRRKLLHGEVQRKFAHITGGTFAAFWPWLVSWRTIQLLGVAMLAGALLNRYKKFSHFADGVRRESYGEIFSALAIILCASLTTEPIFYALAILHLALADGLAAIIGTRYGRQLKYFVFGQEKTIIGTMTFWVVSVIILGTGLLFANQLIDYQVYAALLLVMPPFLAALENLAVYGSDNIVVPAAALVIFSLASSI